MKRLLKKMVIPFKRRNAISYPEYVETFLILIKTFSKKKIPLDAIISLSLREMITREIWKAIKISLTLLTFGILCYQTDAPFYFKIATIALGFLLIMYYFIFIERLLPNWQHYFVLRSKIFRYEKVVNHSGIQENILRDYLNSDENENGVSFAKAIYEDSKESWIKDKDLQKTNYERILILYYLLNKKLNITKSQTELVYLVSSLINVGESNSREEKAKELRKLTEMYSGNVKKQELSNIRPHLTKVKTILEEMIILVDRDCAKIDSLK